MPVTIDDYKALHAVRSHLFVVPPAEAVSDVILESVEVASSSLSEGGGVVGEMGSTIDASPPLVGAAPAVLIGAAGVATAISLLMARSLYYRATYEAAHPQVCLLPEHSHLYKNATSIPLYCTNFSKKSMSEIVTAMGSLGAIYTPTLHSHTHLWTAGSAGGWNIGGGATDSGGKGGGKRDLSDDGEGGIVAGGVTSQGVARPSSWEAADAAGAPGGKAVLDCKMRTLEAHNAIGRKWLLGCHPSRDRTVSDEDFNQLMTHFVEKGSYSVPNDTPTCFIRAVRQPVLAESFQVLISGKEPDVFTSIRRLAETQQGKPITLVYHVALTVDGSSTKVFTGISRGRITKAIVEAAILAGTPESELTHEMLFQQSFATFEGDTQMYLPRGAVNSRTPCRPAQVALPHLLQYALLRNSYDELERDVSTALEASSEYNNTTTGPIRAFFTKVARSTSGDLPRRKTIVDALVDSAADTASSSQKYFTSPRTAAYLQLALYLKFGALLDPPSHPWLEAGSSVLLGRSGDNSVRHDKMPSVAPTSSFEERQSFNNALTLRRKVQDELSLTWRARGTTNTLTNRGHPTLLINTALSGTFAVAIRFTIPRVGDVSVVALRKRMLHEVVRQFQRDMTAGVPSPIVDAHSPLFEVVDEEGQSYPAPIFELRYHIDAHSYRGSYSGGFSANPTSGASAYPSGTSVREAVLAVHHQAHILSTIGMSVDSVNVDLVVNGTPVDTAMNAEMIGNTAFFVSEKSVTTTRSDSHNNKNTPVRLLNYNKEINGSDDRASTYDDAHVLCRKRGICPLFTSDSGDLCWNHSHQYFTFTLQVASSTTAEDISNRIPQIINNHALNNNTTITAERVEVIVTHVSDPIAAGEASSDSTTAPTPSMLYSIVDCRFYRTGYMDATSYFKDVLLHQLLQTVEGLSPAMQGPEKYSVYEAVCSTMH